VDPVDLTQTAVRLVVAALFGGLIGFEREAHSQAAGLRTHMVVAVGSALLMILSIKVAGPGNDPGRIAAQVVSGIGFLGAGAILRYGMSIKGLTTAACLWTAAGIGLACGAGLWREAGAATVIVLITILVFSYLERALTLGRKVTRFTVLAADRPDLVSRAEQALEDAGVSVQQVGISRNKVDGKVEVTMIGTMSESGDIETTVRRLSDLEGVQRVDVD
jgi:putative Mg2+ transporter-C (MgtC) family protein